jgi:hypothetical protein
MSESTTQRGAATKSDQPSKTLGTAIDEIVAALNALPDAVRLTAIRAACESVGLGPGVSAGGAAALPYVNTSPHDDVSVATATATTSTAPQDIRSLKDVKQPKSNPEMACVMAYYLQHMVPPGERKASVSTADIEKYFAQAGFPLPKVPGQVLVDTKAAGYFDIVDRGTYKLNPVGHNLVVHGLPRKGGAASSTRTRKPAGSKKKMGKGR